MPAFPGRGPGCVLTANGGARSGTCRENKGQHATGHPPRAGEPGASALQTDEGPRGREETARLDPEPEPSLRETGRIISLPGGEGLLAHFAEMFQLIVEEEIKELEGCHLAAPTE